MDARKLRLNNYIKDEQDIIYKVVSLSEKSIIGEDLENQDLWENFSFIGIPLTEEILLNIKGIRVDNFVKNETEVSIYKIANFELYFSFGKLRNIKYLKSKLVIYRAFTDVSLHNFQNLYYAIENKELNITL